VLVVDDDSMILDTVSELLEMEGYPVLRAADGTQALQCLERGAPAMEMLDMRMPELDAWGLAREMSARGWSTPIVVMSAAADTYRWAQEIGAAGCVAKPFEADELLGTVARLYTTDPGSTARP
jgi:CheY-like chemotaxis protein